MHICMCVYVCMCLVVHECPFEQHAYKQANKQINKIHIHTYTSLTHAHAHKAVYASAVGGGSCWRVVVHYKSKIQ